MQSDEIHRKIRELVHECCEISEIASRLKITFFAARMCWFAVVDNGPEIKLCPKCHASGWTPDGMECKACNGTGVA